MTLELSDLLAERIDDFAVPPADPGAARAAGRRLRRRRRTTAALAATTVLVVGAGLAVTLPGTGRDGHAVRDPAYASVGALDLSHGARAYADPGVTLYLGGRALPYGEVAWLDTDAVATGSGIVFYDAGRPMLLDASGEVSRLADGRLDTPRGFHPTAKADAEAPLVAWATLRDGIATITVHDLDTGADVGSTTLDCGSCGDLVIDGIDSGRVFVRDATGTRTWTWADDTWRDFAAAGTRVADVRNGVVLFTGPRPADAGDLRLVEAPGTDAQLTLDGRYVLYWSSVLQPTSPGEEPVILAVGPRTPQDGPAWYAVDTDGTILVATADHKVYDCVIAPGSCTELGRVSGEGGDPEFVGVDM
ncbi:hypothetical protein [Nocardioides nitrophenolicus]|uniref:hypothetical protein n=1 Tax=Nocardioides nitrophenolicus TaxID=60489 RepID=UPI001957B466|nr:hypothetical protein [Nocardioides nitrophenolicus]MBM7519660.1 hypothetical protein [Nocardioides nitrophenolicus]